MENTNTPKILFTFVFEFPNNHSQKFFCEGATKHEAYTKILNQIAVQKMPKPTRMTECQESCNFVTDF